MPELLERIIRSSARAQARRNVQFKLTEMVVVLCHSSFTFVDLDQDSGLVISGGREDLTLPAQTAPFSFDVNIKQ